MKKLTMICMSALLMLAVSCKKDKKDEIENAGSGFRATVEQQNGDSKTHLEGLAVKWNSGDAILVKSSTCNTPKRFTTTGTDASANFDAAESLPDNFYTPNYTAYYPAAMFSGDQLTLPATQTYVENTFANGTNPMAATSSTNVLPFKNVCGVLELQLYSATACQVQNITITSNTDEKLYGTGAVTLTGGVPALGTLSNGGSTLTLLMGEGGKAMSTSESAPTAYYFVVPVGTLGTSFTVKMTTVGGDVWTKTANAPQNLIARSNITVLPKQTVATHTPVLPSQVTITSTCENCSQTLGGTVTVPQEMACEFGLVYIDKSLGEMPTLENGTKVASHTMNESHITGTTNFDLALSGLANNKDYNVRAYAMTEDGVVYSSETKTVEYPRSLPNGWTNGKNPHPFTIASGKVVYFSQGNLQYNAIGSSATASPGANVGGTWRFAEHQFDFIGAANANAAQTYTGWIDLFGWGTSGYNHGATCYQPWSTSITYSQYYVYGSSTNHLYSSNGTADWGKNTISNGVGSSWRTLTGGGSSGEWYYLINSRPNAADLYGEGKVGSCTPGLIILPDDWTGCPGTLTFTPGTSSWSNVYSYSEWAQMEAAGAVFLPTAGYRYGTSVGSVGSFGYYWSSSNYDSDDAYSLYFRSDVVGPSYNSYHCHGFSVRLVSDN